MINGKDKKADEEGRENVEIARRMSWGKSLPLLKSDVRKVVRGEVKCRWNQIRSGRKLPDCRKIQTTEWADKWQVILTISKNLNNYL